MNYTNYNNYPIAGCVLKTTKLEHWIDIIEEWNWAIERYCRVTGNDTPYWHSERSNIGVLAAAAWRCGKIALEEFTQAKTENLGRCDLWIAGENFSNYIEAKFEWINILSEQRKESAEKCLKQAMADVEKLSGIENYTGVGVAFLPVYAKSTKLNSPESLTATIHSTISDLKNIECDLITWRFPQQFRTYIDDQEKYLPGIFMIATRKDN